MLRPVQNVPVLVVQVRVNRELAAGELGELLRSSERDDALFLPLVDRRDGPIWGKGTRYTGAPTKKGLGCLNKHAGEITACFK
jgi:hypothetical protein